VTPARYSREIIERVPDATDHWFEGAGHVVPLERVEEFVEIVDSATR
jgi:pimeloyl-ACP methyl ester carboxylesterase